MFYVVVSFIVKIVFHIFAQARRFSFEWIKWKFGPAFGSIFSQGRRFSIKRGYSCSSENSTRTTPTL